MILSTLLKTETSDLHAAAEAHPAMSALVSGTLTMEGYRRHVEALYRFHRTFEDARATGADTALRQWLPDIDERSKVRRLERDLRTLGAGIPAAASDLSIRERLGPLESTADLLGALYVTEGATLGGRILARHLVSSLGIGADSGAAHFCSYGDRRGEMWRRYREALDAFGRANPDEALRVLESARRTFSAFTLALPAPL